MKELNKQDIKLIISILKENIIEQKRLSKNIDKIIYSYQSDDYWKKRKNGCVKKINQLDKIISYYEDISS